LVSSSLRSVQRGKLIRCPHRGRVEETWVNRAVFRCRRTNYLKRCFGREGGEMVVAI
jgi:hypothetical protein